MYLKKIEFNGFKSFAEKTDLVIPPGVTAIVGPNGCGKTNVVDAISWVLGEQSARQLRGFKMEDVIFSGTANRQGVGMAEVSLTFDNADQKLPLDFSEVTLTRRVFRSGEGQYFINRKPCRLKDISDLVLGTGLGNRSYSLVGQGKIDQILQSRPEERRGLLEEAAGISKYRRKRDEAERKLEHTRNNLLRVDDIVREVRRQLAVAQRQTRAAEKYRLLRERLRELEVTLGILRLQGLREQELGGGEEKRALEESFRGLHERARELESELDAVRARMREREDCYHEARSRQVSLRAEIDKARHRDGLNATQAGDLEKHVLRLEAEVSALEESLRRSRSAAAELNSRLEEISGSNRARESDLAEREKSLRALREEMAEAERAVAGFRRRALETSQAEARLHNEFAGIQAGSRELVLRKKKIEVEISRLSDDLAESEQDLNRARAEAAGSSGRLEATRSELETAAGELRREQGEFEAAAARTEKLALDLGEKESQAALLRDLTLLSGGEVEGVKLVLEEAARPGSGLAGVIGPLTDFIEVNPGYEQAVEAVLGEKSRALLVTDLPAAKKVVDFLRARQAARTVLVVRDLLAPAAASGGILEQARFHGPLEGLGPALAGGFSLAEGFPESPSAVTRDGILFFPGGVVAWAGAGASPALYSRPRRLEALEEETRTLRGRSEQAAAARESLQEGIRKRRAQLEGLNRSLREAEVAAALAVREVERLQGTREQAGFALEALKSEAALIEQESGRLSGRRAELEKTLGRGPSLGEELKENLRAAEDAADRVSARVREAEKEVTEIRIELASSREREDSISSRREMLAAEAEKYAAEIESRRREAGMGRERRDSLLAENLSLAEKVSAWEQELQPQEEAIRELARSVEECRLGVIEKEKEYQSVRPRLEEAQSRVGEVEVRLAETRLRRDGICQRLREAYGIELESQPVPEGEFDPEAMAAEIEDIRAKMGKMTNINMAALEDQEVFETRLKLLLEQKEDLEAARIHMEEAIRKINVTARERLQATYEVVRGAFQEIFRQLFEGGRSDLVLEEDKDILESGLEIVAQPPEKKLQHINLLSGGERAMTSIAFIFALFRVQPSPFYLLDEIDAPLDGQNIARFIRLLKSRCGEAQFIIITHNKQTIAEADVIYGITMEESGVSKVVSVKFARETPTENDRLEETANLANPR